MTADERSLKEPTSVVIVGSGFTGFECARHLARRFRRHQRHCIRRHHDHLASRLHAVHTAAARRGRRGGRRPIRRHTAGQHVARRTGCSRPGRQRRLRRPHRHLHRPRRTRTQRVLGSPGPDAGIGDTAFRRSRSREACPRAEVDGRGAVPARPRAGATRVGRCRRRSRPDSGAPNDRGRRRVVFGHRTCRATAGACRFSRQTDEL
jgi:hypothetical protein